MTDDFDIAVRGILCQLLEARDDLNDANKRLNDYTTARTPPDVPNEFEDVDAFLDYHHRRQGYENQLKQHENTLKQAREEYTEAAEQLLLFLPDGVPLRYTYEGGRSALFSTQYVIVRRQGEIVIESPSRTAGQVQEAGVEDP